MDAQDFSPGVSKRFRTGRLRSKVHTLPFDIITVISIIAQVIIEKRAL